MSKLSPKWRRHQLIPYIPTKKKHQDEPPIWAEAFWSPRCPRKPSQVLLGESSRNLLLINFLPKTFPWNGAETGRWLHQPGLSAVVGHDVIANHQRWWKNEPEKTGVDEMKHRLTASSATQRYPKDEVLKLKLCKEWQGWSTEVISGAFKPQIWNLFESCFIIQAISHW